ncbi:Aldose 1-epimerase domain containing protein [Trichostrongylus colubriformis]|uniref:Galactose mutarotase n=1 Tax=Trichostrongylus colubriformis TaxID=6319 RepID=A0AAN8FIR2_TRICO
MQAHQFIEITSTQGVTARMIPLGATLTSLFVRDRYGNDIDVVLGFDNVKEYEENTAYFGSTIGRVCNRIRFGHFVFDGKEYRLPINNEPHHLHGGPKGIATVLY